MLYSFKINFRVIDKKRVYNKIEHRKGFLREKQWDSILWGEFMGIAKASP